MILNVKNNNVFIVKNYVLKIVINFILHSCKLVVMLVYPECRPSI